MKRILEILLLPLLFAQLFAEELPLEKNAQDEAVAVLEPLEVTAYRFSSDALNTPVSSTVITEDEIKQSGALTIPEILQKKANVRFLSAGSAIDSSLSMRGFGDNSQQRILVLVDGQRYNRVDMSNPIWTSIPVDNIESIEVLRGAQSAMYGNNAVAGVIKINTKKGADENNFAVNLMYGSYGTYNVDGSFTGSQGDFFYNLDINRLYTDGYCDNSKAWADNFSASLGYKIDSKNTLEFSGSYGQSDTNYASPISLEQLHSNPRKTGKGIHYFYDTGVYSSALKSESALGKSELLFGMNFRDREAADKNGLNENNQWSYAFNPRMEIDKFEDLKIYTGLDVAYADIDYAFYRSVPINPKFMAENAKVGRIDIGPYVGAEYFITDELSLSTSGRAEASYVHIKDARYDPPRRPGQLPTLKSSMDEDNWQYGLAASAGINYRFIDSASIYARFDQIYRYPTTDEIARYQNSWSALISNFNPDLKPETGQNFEAGVKFIDKKWTLDISFFALFMHDEIMYIKPAGSAVLNNVNAPDTARYGIDLMLNYDDEYWGAFTGATCVDAHFIAGENKGNGIPLVPPVTGFSGLYVKPLEYVTFTAQINYCSKQYEGNDFANKEPQMPSYLTVDFRANITLTRNVSVYGALENAFDENYAAMAFSGAYYPSIGRMFKIGLQINF